MIVRLPPPPFFENLTKEAEVICFNIEREHDFQFLHFYGKIGKDKYCADKNVRVSKYTFSGYALTMKASLTPEQCK